MKNYTKHSKNQGFTIIELMFAIVILGGMLSLTMLIIVGMLRFYVFAGQVRKNQANGRETLDSITREIRFGKLISPSGSAATQEVCVFDKSNNRVVLYRRDVTTFNLKKSIYTYNSNVDPANCDEGVGGSLAGKTKEVKDINLSKMRVTNFEITKTQGASFEVNKNAAAVIINYQFLTGAPDASGAACETKNIFCSKLGYQTAINLRSGD